MANELFDRFAVLKVFPNRVRAGSTGVRLEETDPEGQAYPSRLEDGSPGFRIRFKVNKIIENTPNQNSIWIYNLGPDSRGIFGQINNTVILEAGYGDQSEVIFRGNISRTRTRKVGPDYVTHVECGDGLFAWTNSRIDVAFNAGTNIKDMVNTLKGALGVGSGEQREVPSKTIPNGRVFSGPTRNHLSEVLENEEMDWSIQDGNLVILPKGASSGVPAILLSPSTGLVGIPEQKDVGIEFKALLNPKIKPFQNVVILSKFVNGTYRCLKVAHQGDTFSGQWETQVEAGESRGTA